MQARSKSESPAQQHQTCCQDLCCHHDLLCLNPPPTATTPGAANRAIPAHAAEGATAEPPTCGTIMTHSCTPVSPGTRNCAMLPLDLSAASSTCIPITHPGLVDHAHMATGMHLPSDIRAPKGDHKVSGDAKTPSSSTHLAEVLAGILGAGDVELGQSRAVCGCKCGPGAAGDRAFCGVVLSQHLWLSHGAVRCVDWASRCAPAGRQWGSGGR